MVAAALLLLPRTHKSAFILADGPFSSALSSGPNSETDVVETSGQPLLIPLAGELAQICGLPKPMFLELLLIFVVTPSQTYIVHSLSSVPSVRGLSTLRRLHVYYVQCDEFFA